MTDASPGLDVGLRIDVDTLRGARLGVPGLLPVLQKHGVQATFYFSVGPDNMGRHLWRLLKPAFLMKMLRSHAPSLYGLDILLRGTLWPGPIIVDKAGDQIVAAAQAGHEIGFHAWDHHRWQTRVDKMSMQEMRQSIGRGCQALSQLVKQPIQTSAVAGWRATEAAIAAKQQQGFDYNSDCRGDHIFVPLVAGAEMAPQLPVTMPTYDEVIGREGIDDSNYNQYILNALRPGALNVYTVHAEVEGIARAGMFDDLLAQGRQRGVRFVALRQLLAQVDRDRLPRGRVVSRQMPGREGWVSWQATETT